MPTTTLYLVRHGEAHDSTEGDPGLTDLGRRQAHAVGERLKGIDVPVVHHSSRRRATETAAIIGLNQANGGLTIIRWQDTDPPQLLAFNETTNRDP